MKAYCQGISKQEFIAEIKKHQAADNFIQNIYFDEEEGKGCAVGCSLESVSRLRNIYLDKSNHAAYEKYLGIPTWLAELEDKIFERLDLESAKQWPLRFSTAINVGADLNQIEGKFKIFVLEENINNLETILKTDLETNTEQLINQSISVNKQMIDAIKSKDKEKIEQAMLAAKAAYLAYSATYLAADSAAYSAAYYAADSAYSAADSAEYSEAYYTVDSSAYSAAYSSAYLAADSSAYSAARSATYKKYANKLLQLIRSCK